MFHRPQPRCEDSAGVKSTGAPAAANGVHNAPNAKTAQSAPSAATTRGEASVSRSFSAAASNPQLALTLNDKSSLSDNYSLLGVLGAGSYGEVRLAIHKLTRMQARGEWRER
eukprot:5594531-Pleurochrysis_carterae.AAC.2